MNRISFRQLIVTILIIVFCISVCEAQPAGTGPVGHTKTGLFARIFVKKKSVGVKKPMSASQVKKEKEKKDQKKREANAKSASETQKRTYKIQTPEVQSRMKQNQKDIIEREKARKKKTSESNKKARQKYKK
jgi:hypothetical protein